MILEDFRDRHKGEDVWVVGSDPTALILGPEFFAGRTVVGINLVANLLPVTYTVTKADGESKNPQQTPIVEAQPDMVTVTSEFEQGWHNEPKVNIPGAVVFKHFHNPAQMFDPSQHVPTEPGWLLVSQSTSGSALHFAAHLGAANVFCVGIHGGRFGSRSHSDGYYDEDQGGRHDNTYQIAARQVPGICARLSEMYGTRFVTVLPGGNLRMDGLTFEADYGRLN